MRNYLLNFCYASICLLCTFLTLPLCLPENPIDFVNEDYDTIIVLGGGVTMDCGLDQSLQARMNTAIELFNRKKSAKMILTGGPQAFYRKCVESEAMRQFALVKNIPASAIFKESLALNTYQNAYQSIRLMSELELSKAVVVTSDFHVKRAGFIFQQYNIPFKMIAAPNKSQGKRKFRELFKEQLLLGFHAVFGMPDRFGLDLKEQKFAAVLKSLAQR